MPIYEYCCSDCGHTFEELVKNDREKPLCPKCGHKKTKKMMSAGNFRCGGAMSLPASSSGGGCGGCSSSSCAGCGK